MTMNVEAFEFNTSINPNNFPAKLWRVVNSPCYQSIRWDSSGETIVIDQQLFQSELLCHSQHLYGNDIFKTSNFASFIRQLNLYGFRKIIMGSGNSHKLLNAESNVGFRDGQIHYFRNIYFRRDRPNLLVKIKRLTSTNKAKMAAGLDVSSRPPNRYQRMLTNSQVEQNSGHKQDPVNTGQINCRLRHETVSTYPYMPSTSHSLGFPLRGLDRTPMPSRMWPDSLGLLPRQVESASSFLEQSMCYPVLQRFPTDVSYALQPSATALHVQQNLSNMTGAVQEYNMYVPSAMSYPRTYYPTAVFQCYGSPIQVSPTISFQHCSYFQAPPMHTSFPMQVLPPVQPSNSDERDEINLETVFKYVENLPSCPKAEIVMAETQNNQVVSLSPRVGRKQRAQVDIDSGSLEDCSSETSQLESLTPVHPDITTYVDVTEHSVGSPLSQASECISSILDSQNENPTSERAFPAMQMQSLVSELTTDNTIENHKNVTQSMHRKGTSKHDKCSDLSLLVDVACKLEYFLE